MGTGYKKVGSQSCLLKDPTNKSAVRTGLEPVTPCVTGMYSNQLN